MTRLEVRRYKAKFTRLQTNTINEVVKLADEFNIDRDSLLKTFVGIMKVTCETATFKNYKNYNLKSKETTQN